MDITNSVRNERELFTVGSPSCNRYGRYASTQISDLYQRRNAYRSCRLHSLDNLRAGIGRRLVERDAFPGSSFCTSDTEFTRRHIYVYVSINKNSFRMK